MGEWGDRVEDKSVDSQKNIVQAAASEFIAVFIFVFSGCCAAISNKELFAVAMAVSPPCSYIFLRNEVLTLIEGSAQFGLGIMVMASVFGAVSGGHINPAVSVGFFVTGFISLYRLVVYVIAQLLGGILGAICVKGAPCAR